MDRIISMGSKYSRTPGLWVDENGKVMPEKVQKRLNREYNELIFCCDPHVKISSVLKRAEFFKRRNHFSTASRYYYAALKKAETINDISYILPPLFSCFRHMNCPKTVLELWEYYSAEYGSKIISVELLTSVAAAFCDISDYDNGQKYCNMAYSACNGKANDVLKNVYSRINSHVKNLRY